MRRGDPEAIPEGAEAIEQQGSSEDGADEDVYYTEPEEEEAYEEEPSEGEGVEAEAEEGEEGGGADSGPGAQGPRASERPVTATESAPGDEEEAEYVLPPAGLSDAEREALLTHFDGEQIQAIEGLFSNLLARHSARTAAQHQQYRAMGIPDGFAAEYAQDLEAADAMLAQQNLQHLRGTRQGARTAILTAIGSRIGQKGNIAAELRKAADLLDGKATEPQEIRAPKPPRPPEHKAAPTPAAGRPRPAATLATSGRAVRALRMTRELFGVSEGTARAALTEE